MNTNATGATEATQAAILDDLNALPLLRRIVRLLESSEVVDPQGRQRIILDAITAGLTLAGVTTVTTVTTVATVTSVSNVAAQASLAGMDREMYINQSRDTYALCIRAKLA